MRHPRRPGAPRRPDRRVGAVVIGAGTLGLSTIAAIHPLPPRHQEPASRWPSTPSSAAWPPSSAPPPWSNRASCAGRCAGTGSWILDSGQLTGGAAWSSTASAAPSRSRGAGGRCARRDRRAARHAGPRGVDLTPLWQREIHLAGAYAYAPEPAAGGRHSFDLAMDSSTRPACTGW